MSAAGPADLLNLAGTAVVVTGAGGEIGSGIARRFHAAGASVVVHTRRGDVAPLMKELGYRVVTVAADLTTPDGPSRVVEAAIAAFGKLDVLVNNAGIQPTVGFEVMTDDDFRQMLETNVTAVHRMTQAAARHLIGRGAPGSVVHIASIEGSRPATFHGHYATAKAAVIMHARAAALEYGPKGIRINTVSPGLIARPGIEDSWPEGVARWKAAAPLGRLGTPEDIGDACVFLCSPMARWITGIDLVVDGGMLRATRPV